MWPLRLRDTLKYLVSCYWNNIHSEQQQKICIPLSPKKNKYNIFLFLNTQRLNKWQYTNFWLIGCKLLVRKELEGEWKYSPWKTLHHIGYCNDCVGQKRQINQRTSDLCYHICCCFNTTLLSQKKERKNININ